MKITVKNYNGKDVRVSLEAETSAEHCQIDLLREMLEVNNAHWYDWSDMGNMDGGIGLVVNLRPPLDKP